MAEPREPDRFETATDALERIARAFEANPTLQHSGAAVASILRYLAHEAPSPAAAPAAAPDNLDRCSQITTHYQRCTLLRDHRGDHAYPAPPSEPVAPAPDLRDVEHIDVLIAEFADDPKAALACIGEYVGLRLHNRKPPGAGEGTT